MTFVPDCGGLVLQVAIAIPSAFFQTPSPTDPCRPIVPLGNLVESLCSDIEVFAVVDAATYPTAKAWSERLQISAQLRLIPLAPSSATVASPWIQDGFHCMAVSDGTMPGTYLSAAQIGPVRDLASATGALVMPLDVHVDGGNHLVGAEFRLIGHTDVGKADAFGVIDDRRLHVFGYRVADISSGTPHAQPAIEACQTGALHKRIWPDRMHQYGFHLDQFVTLTGQYVGGRPLLMVAEPVAIDGGGSMVTMAQRCLDASVLMLREQGFEVLRNPVPFIVTPDTRKRLPRLYNNAVVENQIRKGQARPLIWLPQFSDVEPLQELDEANAGLWRNLGFEVRRVYGWTHLASRSGALRCISKVLLRSS